MYWTKWQSRLQEGAGIREEGERLLVGGGDDDSSDGARNTASNKNHALEQPSVSTIHTHSCSARLTKIMMATMRKIMAAFLSMFGARGS